MRRIAHKYTVYGKLKYSSTSLTHFENILQCEVFFFFKICCHDSLVFEIAATFKWEVDFYCISRLGSKELI